jgi:hypothetical protein
MIATRTSFTFFLGRAVSAVVIPFAVLDAVVFGINAYQHDVATALAQVKELAVLEAGLWLMLAFVMFVQRSTNDRFSVMQDEIEELKERISHLETRGSGGGAKAQPLQDT